jgi:hypothetical protein
MMGDKVADATAAAATTIAILHTVVSRSLLEQPARVHDLFVIARVEERQTVRAEAALGSRRQSHDAEPVVPVECHHGDEPFS